MERSWVLVLAVVLGGCSGEDPEAPIVPAGDDDDDTDSPPVDTAPDGSFIDAAGFLVVARFAFDPDLGRHVQFAEPGQGLSPLSVSVVLFDSSVLIDGQLDETTSCPVTLEVTGNVPLADWVETHAAWTGFDVPASATVRDTCRFYGLPGNFGGDAGSHVAKWSWGVGVGALDPVVGEELSQSLPASEWAALAPLAAGGAMRSDALAGGGLTAGDGFTTQGFALGYEVNGNFEIVAGGTGAFSPIPKVEMPLDGQPGVARGYYEVQLGPFGPASALTRDPGRR